MRELNNVIDQMLVHIPIEKKQLISSLLSIKNSCLYSAPEMMPHWWKRTEDILKNEFASVGIAILSEWEKKTHQIWMGTN